MWAFLAVSHLVALRKESVDRNSYVGVMGTAITPVALRKESVDRNNHTWWVDIHTSGRSPQGERG